MSLAPVPRRPVPRAPGPARRCASRASPSSTPGGQAALRNVTLDIPANRILGLIGPSSSGKSTLLRSLNRMTDFLHGTRREGRILLDGADIHAPEVDPTDIRRRVGMVFDTPVPLSRSIFENIAYGRRLKGERDRGRLEQVVESALKAAILWDEVKDRLGTSALRLSGGQQQRLCIARTIALDPEVILLDEPCSGLDPISTLKIEEALAELKEPLQHRARHEQHQAGGARLRRGRLLPHGRAGRVRRDAADLHRARATSAPTTTSRGGSAERTAARSRSATSTSGTGRSRPCRTCR